MIRKNSLQDSLKTLIPTFEISYFKSSVLRSGFQKGWIQSPFISLFIVKDMENLGIESVLFLGYFEVYK
jgi:hypothetical protein